MGDNKTMQTEGADNKSLNATEGADNKSLNATEGADNKSLNATGGADNKILNTTEGVDNKSLNATEGADNKSMETESAADWDPLYGQVKGMHVWRDMLCLPCMSTELMEEMIDRFQFQAGDILMASYPQSSFFWAQDVLWHLHHLDTLDVSIDDKAVLAQRVPFLEHEFKTADPKKILKSYPAPRLLKTHISHRYWADNLEPVKDKVKVILWTAEPKDVVANYCDYWNIKGEFFKFPKIEWNHFFELFKKERLFEGDWYEMNLNWVNEYKDNANLLMLSYEESRRNPHGCVRKMAKFLDIPVSKEQVEKIASMREFDKWPEWPRMFSEEQKEYVDNLTTERVKGTVLANHYPTDHPGQLNSQLDADL